MRFDTRVSHFKSKRVLPSMPANEHLLSGCQSQKTQGLLYPPTPHHNTPLNTRKSHKTVSRLERCKRVMQSRGKSWKSMTNTAGWPRGRTMPLRPLAYTCFTKSGNKGAFRLPEAMWDHFRCTVEPSSGHIRCRGNSWKVVQSPEKSLKMAENQGKFTMERCSRRKGVLRSALNFQKNPRPHKNKIGTSTPPSKKPRNPPPPSKRRNFMGMGVLPAASPRRP